MSLPVGLVLCLYPYFGLSGLPVKCEVPVWLPETMTGSSGMYCAVEERTVSSPVLLLLGLCCPKTLGSLSPGAIPPHVSRLLTMVAYHLPRLTSNSHMSLARMAATLGPSRTRNSLPLSSTGRRLTVLPLATSTRIPSAQSILYLSLYGQGCLNHRVHIL